MNVIFHWISQYHVLLVEIISLLFLTLGSHASHMVAQSVFRSYPADMVYVERRNGFTAAPRKKVLTHSDNQKDKMKRPNGHTSTFELAIAVQEACRPIFVLSHGLLGGMSFVLIMLVSATLHYLREKLTLFI